MSLEGELFAMLKNWLVAYIGKPFIGSVYCFFDVQSGQLLRGVIGRDYLQKDCLRQGFLCSFVIMYLKLVRFGGLAYEALRYDWRCLQLFRFGFITPCLEHSGVANMYYIPVGFFRKLLRPKCFAALALAEALQNIISWLFYKDFQCLGYSLGNIIWWFLVECFID